MDDLMFVSPQITAMARPSPASILIQHTCPLSWQEAVTRHRIQVPAKEGYFIGGPKFAAKNAHWSCNKYVLGGKPVLPQLFQGVVVQHLEQF